MKTLENAIYLRVSTKKQGSSGLGLEAQRADVKSRGYEGREFIEVESGRKDEREVLREAIAFLRVSGGKLVVSKLDRLSRSVRMLFELREAMLVEGIEVVVLNLPNFDTLSVGIYAVMAQHEAEVCSERTKKAMAEKRKRDGEWRVGNWTEAVRAKAIEARRKKAEKSEPRNQAKRQIVSLVREGWSFYKISKHLNESGFKAPRGGFYTPKAVSRLASVA
jgi:DNA invertase Pin-like site-specific DNA recombinase